jgi:hypothetical protein
MEGEVSGQKIDLLKLVSLSFYAALSLTIFFGSAFYVCTSVVIVAHPPRSLYEPLPLKTVHLLVATGVVFSFIAWRIWARSRTKTEFVDKAIEVLDRAWWPLVASLPIAMIAAYALLALAVARGG